MLTEKAKEDFGWMAPPRTYLDNKMASVATASFCSQVEVSQSGFATPHRSSRPSNAARYTWADSSIGPWPSQVILTASFATGAPSTCPKQKPPMCHQLLLSSTGSACKAGLVTVKSAMQRELIAKANKPWKIAMMQTRWEKCKAFSNPFALPAGANSESMCLAELMVSDMCLTQRFCCMLLQLPGLRHCCQLQHFTCAPELFNL